MGENEVEVGTRFITTIDSSLQRVFCIEFVETKFIPNKTMLSMMVRRTTVEMMMKKTMIVSTLFSIVGTRNRETPNEGTFS